MRIGLHFLFQLDLQKKTGQVQFESDAPIMVYDKYDKNSFVLLFQILIFKCQTNWFLQMKL